METEIKANLAYKYRLYPNKEQEELLNHQMFISNQAYNICLNLQQENWEANENLEQKDRIYPKASEIDEQVKQALKNRNLAFKTVVAQQARINCEKALKSALTIKNHGFPKFKNSKLSKQSFNWNNQGFSILDCNNPKNRILRIMKENIKFQYSRDFPEKAKVKQISFSKEGKKYFVSFTLEFEKTVFLISKENLDITKAVGIDLNIEDIALSNGDLLKTQSKEFSKKKYDLIAVENLKKLIREATNENVKQQSGLNRSLSNTSFYQFTAMLEYKAKLNGIIFVKVPPQYTSKTCSKCGKINENLERNNRKFECICGFVEHRDINAAVNILSLGLQSFGLGISLVDSKHKAFRLDSSESTS